MQPYQIPLPSAESSVLAGKRVQSEGPSRSFEGQIRSDKVDVTHLQPVGQNDVGVHGPHVQVVDKGTLNSVRNIPQGIQFDLDFITNLRPGRKELMS